MVLTHLVLLSFLNGASDSGAGGSGQPGGPGLAPVGATALTRRRQNYLRVKEKRRRSSR